MEPMGRRLRGTLWILAALLPACGDDGGGYRGTQADQLGVGAECTSDSQCFQDRRDGGIRQACLQQFKGGYCGVQGCQGDDDCPDQSACVAHTDGKKYCFRICANKPECNLNRSADNASNCSSNVDFVDRARGAKACVPPSG